jgi:hypothetical protein
MLLMDWLTNAIQTKADADSTLTGLVNAIRCLEVDDSDAMPYIVFYIIDNKGLYEFAGNGEEAIVQFSIFSDAKFDTEISAIFYALDACFHKQDLTYADGYESVSCLRVGMTGPERVEDGALMITADYRIKARGVT